MLPFAVVLLCFAVGVFGQERPVPPPPSFTDDYGNNFTAKVDGAKLLLYNSSGALLANILNENGWVVALVPDRKVCVIVDPNVTTAEGDCFEEVTYIGVVPDNLKRFCSGMTIMKHVRVNCTVEQAGRKKRHVGQAKIWPKWSWCCRWIPIAWWPCSQSVCFQYNTFGQCVSWGCVKWCWRWHWIQLCLWGYSWPWYFG